MADPVRFPIRFDRFNRTLALVGLRARSSWVEVADDRVTVVMGWAFHLTAPRSAITSVRPDLERVTGWGVHGWRGVWLVNGSSNGMVRIDFDPKVRARSTGFPVHVAAVRVSVVDPNGLISMLENVSG